MTTLVDNENARDLECFLKREIEQSVINPGKLLPPEKDLCSQFKISRYKVRDVLRNFKNQGLIYKVQGKGTFVAFDKFKANWRLKGICTSPIREDAKHLNPSSEMICAEKIRVYQDIGSKLGIQYPEEIFYLEIVRSFAEKPYSYSRSYIPAKAFPDLLSIYDGKESLHGFLKRHFGVTAQRSSVVLETILPDKDLEKALSITHLSPVFFFKSIFQSESGNIIEFRESYNRGDMCALNFVFE